MKLKRLYHTSKLELKISINVIVIVISGFWELQTENVRKNFEVKDIEVSVCKSIKLENMW